jgi:hypothetical protein
MQIQLMIYESEEGRKKKEGRRKKNKRSMTLWKLMTIMLT